MTKLRSKTRHLLLALALLASAAAPAVAGAAVSEPAAKALGQILGTPVAVEDVRIGLVRRTLRWPLSIDFVRQAVADPDATYAWVSVRDPRFTSAFFQVHGTLQQALGNASFVVAVGDSSAVVSSRDCTVRLCNAAGGCDTLTLRILYGTCPPDVCSSAADCGGLGGVYCNVRACDPWGNCTVSQVPSQPGQACPPNSCTDSSECPTTASTKQCTYKRCSSANRCEEVTIEIDASAPCPVNECTQDSQCGGGGGDGGILGDILETQGTF